MALQVLQFCDDHTGNQWIQLKFENLQSVLKTVNNRPVCVVSIFGPTDLGKSFLLNYILRCLEASQRGVDDWIDKANPRKPLDGFRWKSETHGVCLWGKPIILKNSRGKEFAVLVINTQAIFDEYSDSFDKAVIGMCLLLSSVSVLNISPEPDELYRFFRIMKLFTEEYGNLAMSESIEKPFGKLHILVRNWNESEKYPLGKDGGRKLLKTKLRLNEKHQKPVEREIRNFFTEIECYLMPSMEGPHPKCPTKQANYDGNFGALRKVFANRLEEFVSGLVENDLGVKKSGGNALTAKHFLEQFTAYSQLFSVNLNPTGKMIQSMTKCLVDHVIFNCLSVQTSAFEFLKTGPRYLTDKAFETIHKDAKKKAISGLNDKAKLYDDGNKTVSQVLLKSLEILISKEMQAWKLVNDEKRRKARANGEAAAANTFQKQFTEKVRPGTTSFEIRKLSKTAVDLAFSEFLNHLCGNESEAEIQALWSPWKTNFEKAVSFSLNQNGKGSPKQSTSKQPSKLVNKQDDSQMICFSCPICFEVPKGKVFQCQNGHVICEKCCEIVKKCPQCRLYLTGAGRIRNRAMEEILEKLKLAD